MSRQPSFSAKLAWSLPWLVRYPLWRANEIVRRMTDNSSPRHLIFIVANHFEPAWDGTPAGLDHDVQLKRVDKWYEEARRIGNTIRDCEGTPFRHTNFYPAEQYYKPLVERLAAMQAEGLGEVEIHLHHGVDRPDNAANLRRVLEEFRDILAEDHKCLSRREGSDQPMYAFVHGNWALANSARGEYCGVDSEMQILAQTGCYADFTLPSIHSPAQVARFNAIYQCGKPLSMRAPHRTGPDLKVGDDVTLPILITGPLVFDWHHQRQGLPVPRMDDGVLGESYPLDLARLHNWQSAGISVRGRPEWTFIKLYCHGFFGFDQASTIGDPMRRFMESVLELSDKSGSFKVHFATAREAFNLAMAAIDGHKGEPGQYRDYQLQQIMQKAIHPSTARRGEQALQVKVGRNLTA